MVIFDNALLALSSFACAVSFLILNSLVSEVPNANSLLLKACCFLIRSVLLAKTPRTAMARLPSSPRSPILTVSSSMPPEFPFSPCISLIKASFPSVFSKLVNVFRSILAAFAKAAVCLYIPLITPEKTVLETSEV